jgi:uncharacterized protein YaiE (UPF0345 family)
MKKALVLALAFIICFSTLSSIQVMADTEYETFYTWDGTADGWTISEATTYGIDTENSWAFTASGNSFVAGNSSYKHITRAFYDTAVTESVYESQFSMTGFGRDATGNKIPEAVAYLNYINQNHYYKLSVGHQTGTSGYNRVLMLKRYYGWNSSIGNFNIETLGTYTLAENIALTEQFSVKLAANVDRSGTDTAIKVYLFDNSDSKNLVIDAVDTNGVLADGKLGFEAYANISLSIEGITLLRPESNLPDPATAVYPLNGDSANWNLSGGAVFNDDITCIKNSWASSDLNMKAIYRGHLLSGNYEIGVKSNSGGNANGNVNYIYFNYADSLNYYCITQGGYNASIAGATAPVKLGKYVGGTYEEIASYEAAHSSKTYAFTIKQENGFISISYVSGTTTHTPFTDIAVDDNLNSGFVGFGTKSNMGVFTELTLSGDVSDVSLKLEQSSIADGAEDIPLSNYLVGFGF